MSVSTQELLVCFAMPSPRPSRRIQRVPSSLQVESTGLPLIPATLSQRTSYDVPALGSDLGVAWVGGQQ